MSIIALAVSGIAAALSISIFIGSIGMKGLPGCGKGSACDDAVRGRWSRWASIPVSGFGVAAYGILFVALLTERFHASSRTDFMTLSVTVTAVFIIIGSIIWFVAIQAIVLRRFCMYCMAIHLCGVVAAFLVFIDHPAQSVTSFHVPLAIAVLCLAVLIGGQIYLKPKTYAIFLAPAPLAAGNLKLSKAPVDIEPIRVRTASNRNISLFNGRLRLRLDEWPLLGANDAERVVVWLFDFTCKECRHLHGLLHDAVKHFDGRLAIAMVPVPQHPACNRTVKCNDEAQIYSCQFARLALAIWSAAPERYRDWDAFMADSVECQPFGLALMKASELADLSQFEIRNGDLVLDRRIEEGIAIFIAAKGPKIPSLVLSKGILSGHIPDAKTLIDLLTKHDSP